MRTKKHRLPEAAYYGEVSVAFTACEVSRKRMFDNHDVFECCLSALKSNVERFLCDAPVYCFMPDHLHVIVKGREFHSRPKIAMDRFKHETGNWLHVHHPEFEWQDDFHDHIIRKSEDWRGQVQYIAANPVRAGLVEDMFAYPLTGSIEFKLEDVLMDTML